MFSYTRTTFVTVSPVTQLTTASNSGSNSYTGDNDYTAAGGEGEGGETASAITDSDGNRYTTNNVTATSSGYQYGVENGEDDGATENVVSSTVSWNGKATIADANGATVASASIYSTTFADGTTTGSQGGRIAVTNTTTTRQQWTTTATTIGTGSNSYTTHSFRTTAQTTNTIRSTVAGSAEVRIIKSATTNESLWYIETFASETAPSQTVSTATAFGQSSFTVATIIHPDLNEIVWVATTTSADTCHISDIAESYNDVVTVLPAFVTSSRQILQDPQEGSVTGLAETVTTATTGTAATTRTATTQFGVVIVSNRMPMQTEQSNRLTTRTTQTTWETTLTTLSNGHATALTWTSTDFDTIYALADSNTYHLTRAISSTVSWTAEYGLSGLHTFSELVEGLGPDPGAPIGEGVRAGAGETSFNETASNTYVLGFETLPAATAFRVDAEYASAAANYSDAFGSNFQIGKTISATYAKLNQTALVPSPTTYESVSGTSTSTIEIGGAVTVRHKTNSTTYAINPIGQAVVVNEERPPASGAFSPKANTFVVQAGKYLLAYTSTSTTVITAPLTLTNASGDDTPAMLYSALPDVVGMGTMRYFVQTYAVP